MIENNAALLDIFMPIRKDQDSGQALLLRRMINVIPTTADSLKNLDP
jgi:hypothetical protein